MNILLLSDVPPCTNYTAGIVIDKMCDFVLEEQHKLCCFSVELPGLGAIIPKDKLKHINFEKTEMPRENWISSKFKLPKKIRAVCSLIGNRFISVKKIDNIAKRVAGFAKENNVDVVWCIVQGHATIRLALNVPKMLKLPYVLQVWDTPLWWMKANNFNYSTKNYVMKMFGEAIHNSSCLISASWAMSKEYEKRYNPPKSIPVILGVDEERPVSKCEKNANEFVIAFSGQLYALEEINALIRALDILNWEYEDKKIVLKLYTRYTVQAFSFDKPSRIMLRGWINQKDLFEELANADLLYCPYNFSEEFREVAALSFPSKLTTYLKIGRAVLFHGPKYSSPIPFLDSENAAYICDTMDIAEIAKKISFVVKDENIMQISENGYNLFKKTLTLKHMKKAFLSSLACIEPNF